MLTEDPELTNAKEELYEIGNIVISAQDYEAIISQGVDLGYVDDSDDNYDRLDYFFTSQYLDDISVPEGYGFYRSYCDLQDIFPYEDIVVEIYLLPNDTELDEDFGEYDHCITINVTGTGTPSGVETEEDETTTPETTVTTTGDTSAQTSLDQEVPSTAFTQDEIDSGKDLKIELTVNEVAELTEAEQTIIDDFVASLEDSYTVAMVLDIDLTKYIGDGDAIAITDLEGEEITITIDIPEDMIGKDLVIIRLHEDVADVLEDIDEDEATYTFKTDRFSSYILSEVSVTADTDVPQTGDMGTALLLVVLASASFAGILVLSKKRLAK